MDLRDYQMIFAEKLGLLIQWVYDESQHPDIRYAVTMGDAYRDPRVHGDYCQSRPGAYGRACSNHKIRLAQDLNLFIRNGSGEWEYCRTTDEHEPLGMYWESLSTMCFWGGHHNDGNHYSLLYRGRW